jgi:hypothetical protein
MLAAIYQDQPLPPENEHLYLYNTSMAQWQRLDSLTSAGIRNLMTTDQCITRPKLFHTQEDIARSLYKKISSIKNIPNRTKLLRLVHGDVYCGVRLKKFGLTDNDLCVRCFAPETIMHLLIECPYSEQVWNIFGVVSNGPLDILDGQLNQAEMEIRADIINALVFRKQALQPKVLVQAILSKFSKGLCRLGTVTGLAQAKMIRHAMLHG